MTYSATADWLRQRLWVGAVVGCVPWGVWLISLAIGGWYKDAENSLLGADHMAFFHAAHLIRDGQASRLYDYQWISEQRYQQKVAGWDYGGFLGYRNPPFYALLYVPTAGLGFYASFLIWTAIGLGLLGLAIWLLGPQRPGRVFLWSLGFYPVFATVSFGQNTFISLAVFAGVYRLLVNDRRFAAGLVAGLLWFKPQLLLGLFVWWVFQPRRYFACWLGVGVTGLVLAAVSWLAVPDGSRAFVNSIEGIAAYGGEAFWNKHSPRAFWAMLLTDARDKEGTDDKDRLVVALAAACSLAGIAVAWWVKQKSGAPVAVMFPVAVFLSLWATPHALIYEWALLIAAAVVLWENRPASRGVWLCLFALAWLALTVSTTFAYLQIEKLKLPISLQVSVPVLGAVGWLAARELARSREAQA